MQPFLKLIWLEVIRIKLKCDGGLQVAWYLFQPMYTRSPVYATVNTLIGSKC